MLKKYSVTIKGHQTSISLEPEFWEELKKIALNEKKSLGQIISEIDACDEINENLSSNIRVFVLKEIKKLF